MYSLLEVVAKILPIILLLVLGNVLQKIQFFKDSTINDFKKLVVNFTLPALLFLAFLDTEFESSYIIIVVVMFIACVLMLIVGIFYKKLLKSDNRYVSTVFTSFENGMIGYPLFVTVYGSASLYKIAVIDIGHILFVFLILVNYLQKLNGKTSSFKELLLSFFKSPIIMAVLLGILFSTTGSAQLMMNFQFSYSIIELLTIVGSLTVPLICIVIGYELKLDFKNISKPFGLVLIRMSTLLVLAFLLNTFIIDGLLQLDKEFQIALYLTFLLPPAFAIPIFMDDKSGKNKQLILNMISINILLTIVAFLILVTVI
ncbi:AEC family transporter [Anaerobacillus alkalidiazotrophicus]|uniref:AEC family transporter n=1 Tax=Anaerobacillus alkalidiazotrophicus TaxID=472963 RepID=UPI001471C8DF|nr:AEC family transporter [Anaerobacillus alkalidiazotrophicus]